MFLGLDVGQRRIGVALSDALGLARPLLTLGRTHFRKEMRDLSRLIRRHNVAAIVVGNPLHLSGDISPQARRVQEFAEALQNSTGLPVHLWDERLTSRAAEELLDAQGVARGPGRKAILDQAAAVVILQGWLNTRAVQSQREQNVL